MFGGFGVLFVVTFLGTMGPRCAIPEEQDHIDVPSIHPLYRFPQNVSQTMLNNYANKLGWLYNREFALAPLVDWSWLRGVGMVTEVKRYWTKLFLGEGFTFQCNVWHDLFSIQEPVYRELSIEKV